MVKTGKRIFYLLWILFIVFLIVVYIQNPAVATPEYLKEFIQSYGDEMMLVYIILTLVRGFFLIPSTPFVICGALLFPDQLFLVLVISMVGVMFSATALYYFSDLLGFSEYLEKKHPKTLETWKTRLRSPKATLIVIAWAFFPLLPTDLVCYAAGIVKLPYKYLFIGVFIGEVVLTSIYVYSSAAF